MNVKRIHYAMIALTVLLFGASCSAVYYGNSVLTKKAQKLVDLKLNNMALDEQQKSLIQANKDIAKYADLEKTANAVVPQDKDQAKTVREIIKIADESGIKIANISFPPSTLGSAALKSAASSSNSSDTTPKVSTPAVTQVKPVEGISGVYVMEVNVQSDTNNPVRYSQFIAFLTKLENNRRTAQVSTITVTPSPKDRSKVTFSLAVNVYIKQ